MNLGEAAGNALVVNGVVVQSLYGYWPRFHDSEVAEFCLRINKVDTRYITDVVVKIRHWGQDDPTWSRPGPNCLIEFLCRDISNANINVNDLVAGGWLDELNISAGSDELVVVDMRPLAGFDVKFDCRSVEVVAIHILPPRRGKQSELSRPPINRRQ
jgi:hypothetical protein